MPYTIGWQDILLRLALTVLAGTLLGLNRTERGTTAGLRTTLLVSLAAAVAMIQVNLLLGMADRPNESVIKLDLMRLPLGILTGMGFIGGGAILRRGDRISGITTAATLWLATVLGLCFGGGQNLLGLIGLVLGFIILGVLHRLEIRIPQDHHVILQLVVSEDGPTDADILAMLTAGGYQVTGWDETYIRRNASLHRKIRFEFQWIRPDHKLTAPEFIERLSTMTGVHRLRWHV